MCGVSAVTVSAIVRNPTDSRYSDRTKRLVLDAAKSAHYVPNLSARRLRGGRSMMLALVLPWNNTEMMDEAQRAAKAAGYGLVLEFTPEPHPDAENESLENALLRHVDGIIWMPARPSVSDADIPASLRGRRESLMMVTFSGDVMSSINRVYTDYRKDMRIAAEHFKRGGCQEVIFASPHSEAANLHYSDELRLACSKLEMQFTVVAAAAADGLADQLTNFLRTVRYRVGILGSDFASLEAVNACERLGKRVPQEVGILAHGDLLFGGRYRIGELKYPNLSAVRIPFGELGRRAVEELLIRLKKPGLATANLCLPTQLIERGSTMPVSSN